MTLVFACEQRFISHNNVYYTDNSSYGDALWARYLNVFDNVIVVARVRKIETIVDDVNYFRISNSRISFVDMPYYIGPIEYLKKRSEIKKIAKKNAINGRAYICRVPGQMGLAMSSALRKKSIPYAVEVVGDPWDVFAPGAIKHPLSPLFRITARETLRRITLNAAAVLYVTKFQLQKRYPAKKNAFTTNASDVFLNRENVITPRPDMTKGCCVKLLAIGSLSQMYKSPDIAVKALALLKKKGIVCSLTWLGDGQYKNEMICLANKLNVGNEVIFAGNVSSEKVWKNLAETDIFLHISRTEGLPRAVIEAMGAGLPCIGSRVGGIPELLDDIALVNEIKPEVVANKIIEFLKNSDLMQHQAMRNFEEANNYRDSILSKRRNSFYEYIKSSCV